MAALEARSLYKVFGDKPEQVITRLEAGEDTESATGSGKTKATAAVIDASFSVESGEIFVVMGLSGSGKSTLIRMLNGLHTPTGGQVLIHGDDISSMSAENLRKTRREHISMVFQHFALFPHRTVAENAAYGLKIKGMSADERRAKALEALEMVGLDGWGDHKPSQLSGGMQQRVGLARALAAETDIMLMDEAFSALDPLIRKDMQDQLIDLQRQLGKTIVFITHDLNEAMRLGDRIAMMREGRIEQIGTATEILDSPASDYVERFVSDVDRSRVLTAAHLMKRLDQPVPTGQVTADDIQPMSAAVAPGTLAADLFGPSSQSPLPVPVVSEGELVGYVPRESLLGSLSTPDESAVPAAANDEGATR